MGNEREVEAQVNVSRSKINSILIVDDAQTCKQMKEALQQHVPEVYIAHDSGQARGLVSTRQPDVVLTEAVLPRESGFELAHYLKYKDDGIAVILVSEVDSDPARQLAIFCGADGYLSKPVGEEQLLKLMQEIAEAVWLRKHTEASSDTGMIEFQCVCGHKLTIRLEYAGRSVPCPKCLQLIKSPKFGAQADETDEQVACFFCGGCGTMVKVPPNHKGATIVCKACSRQQDVPRLNSAQKKFFYQRPSTEAKKIRANLSRFITVRCSSCDFSFSIDPDRGEAARMCPRCKNPCELPSIKGSPLARAALASTGRLFAFMTGPMKGKKFLVPDKKEVLIGTAEDCHIRLDDPSVLAKHCAIRATKEGLTVRHVASGGATLLNEDPISETVIVQPGDVLEIGHIKLVLLGNRKEEDAFLSRKSADGKTETKMKDARIAQQAAQILQVHWEKQRELLKQNPKLALRETQPPAPQPKRMPPSAAGGDESPLPGTPRPPWPPRPTE